MPRNKKDGSLENLDLFEVAPDELDNALADLPGDDSQLTIYRCRDQGQGHPIFVATYPPSEFSLELIQENHGGGKYNIYAKRDRQIVKRLRVEIEGEPKIFHGTVPLSARQNPYKFGGWRSKVQLEEDEQKAKLSGIDPTTFMLMNEIKNLKEALKDLVQNSGSGGGGFDRKSFMQELVMFKELFSPSNPVADQTGMISTILQKGLEIGARAANGDVGSSSWVDTIKELIPVAQQALSAFANKAAIENAVRAGRPAPINVLPDNPTRQPSGFGDILPNMTSNDNKPPTGFAAIAPMLKAYIPLVIGTASRNGDPGAIVDIIDNNISEDQKPYIVEWLSSPSWYTDLCSLDPRIQLQAAWWSEFHDILLAQLTGVDPQAVGTNGTGDDEGKEI